QTLQRTLKFNHFQVIKDNEAEEPYIREEDSNNILFGFVNMENVRTDQTSENSILLELECPKECTVKRKRWICAECGDYVTLKENQVRWQFLFCSCGSKRYKDESLICHHPSHRPQQSNRSQTQIDYEALLPRIRRELQIIKERYGGYPDVKVHIAIDYLSG